MTQQPGGPSPFAKQTSRYFKFGKQPGSSIQGTITHIGEPRQSYKYDPRPGAPKVLDFYEGAQGGPPRPKMEVVLTLQTDLRDDGPDDDGMRKLVVPIMYKDGSLISAIQNAIDAAGGKDIAVGAQMWAQFTGFDPDSQNPDNPRKLYAAGYRLPPAGGGAFQQGGGQQQQPAQQPQFNQGGQLPPAPQQPYQQPQQWQQPQPGGQQQPQPGGQQYPPADVAGVPFQQQPQQDPWGSPVDAAQQAQQWQPPAGGQPIAPVNPTPQQQQAAASFYGSGPQPGATYQPPANEQPPGQPFGQQQPPQQVDPALIQQMIAGNASDGDIMGATGASLQQISAIRNLGR